MARFICFVNYVPVLLGTDKLEPLNSEHTRRTRHQTLRPSPCKAVCCKACNVNLKSYLREPFKIDTTAQKHHVPYLRVQHTAIHHITQSVPPPNFPTESSSSHKHTHALYLQSMEFKFRAIDERTTPCRSSPSPSSHRLSYFSEQALRGPVRSTAQWPLSSVWLLKYKTRKE